jgi:hypothetical protein
MFRAEDVVSTSTRGLDPEPAVTGQHGTGAVQSPYANRELGIIFLKSDPVWNPLRSNARFEAIERRAGLID